MREVTMSTAIATPTILTLQEAADMLKVSSRTLYSLTKPRGPIPCVRCGPRGVRYTLTALQRFIEDQENCDGCPDSCSAPDGQTETNGK
jgi:excisionase family DNA binding protein